MNDWHALAAADLAAEEAGCLDDALARALEGIPEPDDDEPGNIDDALAAAGVDPYTPVDRLPERGAWALAIHMVYGDDE